MHLSASDASGLQLGRHPATMPVANQAGEHAEVARDRSRSDPIGRACIPAADEQRQVLSVACAHDAGCLPLAAAHMALAGVPIRVGDCVAKRTRRPTGVHDRCLATTRCNGARPGRGTAARFGSTTYQRCLCRFRTPGSRTRARGRAQRCRHVATCVAAASTLNK